MGVSEQVRRKIEPKQSIGIRITCDIRWGVTRNNNTKLGGDRET